MFLALRHQNCLNKCFNDPTSPFELCYTNRTAFGVVAKKEIKSKQYLNKYLTGSVQPQFKNKKWFSQTYINEEYLPIVGSISFINHGCTKHSNVEVEWVDVYTCRISFMKKIKKGEELLYTYPEENTYCNQTSFDCIRCQEMKDKKRELAHIRKSQRIISNDLSKKRKTTNR